MRLLVACSNCRRQFDASGLDVGERFACGCGTMVDVEAPVGHDAAVVRCSSCGAPREAGSANCASCESDFTIHERDLHTVCPACFARVSDRAKFCHHCGGHLAPEQLAGDKSALVCPACDEAAHLRGRSLGSAEIHVMECGRCAGFWLGTATFDRLIDDAKRNALPANTPGAAGKRQAASQRPSEGEWRYRRCPVCDDLMPRRNFASRSGIIVDLCRDHGVWFDIEELPRLLAWVRAGGLQIASANHPPNSLRRRSSGASRGIRRGSLSGGRQSFGNADGDGFSDSLLEIGLDSLASA
ncbi:MAG: zinc ribbon domain-containing protein, partial [Pirellulales bacterium]